MATLPTLKDARKNLGYTQIMLAKELKMPLSTYALREKDGDFTEDEKKKIAKCLKLDMTTISWKPPYQAKPTVVSEQEAIRIQKLEARLENLEKMVAGLTALLTRPVEKR